MSSEFKRIAFNKLNGVLLPSDIIIDEQSSMERVNVILVTSTHELLNFGYSLSKDLYLKLNSLDDNVILSLCKEILAIAAKSVGAHVKHKAFYPNFPQQVMEAHDIELFINAIVYYWTRQIPDYVKIPRIEINESNPKQEIHQITIDEVKEYFFLLLASKTSTPADLQKFIEEGISEGWVKEYTGEIPFKETLCKVAANMVKKNQPIDTIVTTTTDILRVMAELSGGDIELKKRVKLKSFPRKQRRIIINALEKVINISDVKRNPDLWKRAFHCLHIGEYGGKASAIATKFRNQRNVHTSETIIAEAIKKSEIIKAVDQLMNKPSVFARTLDKLIRASINDEEFTYVIRKFTEVVPSVSSKVLLQLLGHFQGRIDGTVRTRIVITAGTNAKALLAPLLPVLPTNRGEMVIAVINGALISSFKQRNLITNKKVYIDPMINKVLLPLQLSSISNTKKTLSRGSRIPLEINKPILRIFHHWIGKIVDLGAIFITDFDKDTRIKIDYVNWTRLRNQVAIHSGDVINAPAPGGASEFIDIDQKKALEAGFRYVAMDVRVWYGENFSKLERTFAGYMLREEGQSGEIFEPSTVRLKFDITADTRSVIPCVFDLVEQEFIWIDAPLNVKSLSISPKFVPNNTIQHNAVSVAENLLSYLEMTKRKVTINQLVHLHAEAVGSEIVTSKEEADFVVGLDECDLSIYDFSTINSLWI